MEKLQPQLNPPTAAATLDELKPTKVRSCATCRTRKIKCSQDRPICRCCAKVADLHAIEGAGCIYYDVENEVDLHHQMARCFAVPQPEKREGEPEPDEVERRIRKKSKGKRTVRRKKAACKAQPPRSFPPKIATASPAPELHAPTAALNSSADTDDEENLTSHESPTSISASLAGSPPGLDDSLSPSPSPLELATPRGLYPDVHTFPFESVYLDRGKPYAPSCDPLQQRPYGLGLEGIDSPKVSAFWEGGPLAAEELSAWEGLKMESATFPFAGAW